jgi:hypothetical protein
LAVVQVRGSYHTDSLFEASIPYLIILTLAKMQAPKNIQAAMYLAPSNTGPPISGGGLLGEDPLTLATTSEACASDSGGKGVDDIYLTYAPTTPIGIFMNRAGVSENKDREKLHTASVIPQMLNADGAYESRYAFTVNRMKKIKKEPSDFLKWLMSEGHRCEPLILEKWNRLYAGKYFAFTSGFLLDTEHPDKFGATPDGLVFDYDGNFIGVLEIKYRARAGLSATADDIPLKYLLQIAGQTMCTTSRRFFYAEGFEDENRVMQYAFFEGEIAEWYPAVLRNKLLNYLESLERYDAETYPKRCEKYRDRSWAVNLKKIKIL